MRGTKAKRLRRERATMAKDKSRPRPVRRRKLREELHPYTVAHDRNRKKAAEVAQMRQMLANFAARSAMFKAEQNARERVGL